MAKQIKATLVSGNTYVLGNRFFEFGKPAYVTKKDMEHLKEHAVIRNKANGRVFLEQQFEFEEVDEDEVLTDDGKGSPNAAPAVKQRQTRKKVEPTKDAE